MTDDPKPARQPEPAPAPSPEPPPEPVPDAGGAEPQKLGDAMASAQEVDVAPAPADPAPKEKWIKKFCAGCGAFIENIKVAFTGPGSTHGHCEKCAKEFFHAGAQKEEAPPAAT